MTLALPRVALAVAAAVVGSCAVFGVSFSDATWTDQSTTSVLVSTSEDWTPPVVSMVDPGATVGGVTTVVATASDARSAVASVLVEYDAPGLPVAWTSLCTDTTAPYSCSWDTTTVDDGSPYRLRATATDTTGLSTISGAVSTRVRNFYLSLQTVPSIVKGTVTLSATWHGTGSQVVTFERSADGSTGWQDVGCGGRTAFPTATCSWNTTTGGSQRWYLRASVTYAGWTYSDVQAAGVVVDNVAPTVALSVPSGTLYATVQLTATAGDVGTNPGDVGSGVASVKFEYRKQGVTPWTACATVTTAPYSCALNTVPLGNGTYQFQATATDVAGNSATTPIQTGPVSNASFARVTAPTAATSIDRGADVVVTADAYAVAGVASVTLQYDVAGGGLNWVTICTDTTAPYSCSWETVSLPAGATSLRAQSVAVGGATTTSPTVSVTIVLLKGADVQATPVEGVTSTVRPGAGDVLTLTYSAVVDLTSIQAGWTGSSTPVGLTFKDKTVATGRAIASKDWVHFTDTNLGQVAFTQDYVAGGASVVFTGSMMTATTETVGGVQRTVVTVVLGPPDPLTLASLNFASAGTMTWTPSASVLSVDGGACAVTATGETGALDKDL